MKGLKFLKDSYVFLKIGSVVVYRLNKSFGCSNVPILLVPSFINRSYIFCLGQNNGFAGYLAELKGIDLYLICFNHPLMSELSFTLGDYITKYICFIIQSISSLYCKKISVLGYCLGGILSVSSAVLLKNQIGSLVLIATPWDFQVGIYNKIYHQLDKIIAIISNMSVIPSEFIMHSFAMLQLGKIIKKYDKLHTLSVEERQLFWLIEDWIHDGIDINANVIKEILISWIKNNTLSKGSWEINNMIIDPVALNCPTFFAIPKNDHLVPMESALKLLHSTPSSYTIFLEKGHINIFAKNNQSLWYLIYNWITSNS